MAKKEAKTDLWVYELSKEADIQLEPQGSTIKEIYDALKTASKRGTGKSGFPEYVGVVKDFILVIENKASVDKHIKINDKKQISQKQKDITNYAVNGALFYGKHLANNTSYKKVIAIGVSGDEKKHKISPIFIDETEYYRELPEVESFISFNQDNIDEYYTREILKEETDKEKELSEILKDAAELHEGLRSYGSLKDIDKPLVVSGILLALREKEHKGFSIDDLSGDEIETDGEKIFHAIEKNLKRANVAPEVKRDKILSQFSIIKDTKILNEQNKSLNKTPLKHFTEFLEDRIYKSIRYSRSSEDYLGRFYGEFMSYSGGDGQTLGIVLTPKHITDLFCDLINIQKEDVVLDPCAGTAGFLIAAMHYMLSQTDTASARRSIKQKQLHGIESQSYMFTIATTNMILRGDGKSNLINENFLNQEEGKLQLHQATVGMMNPPYSQGSKQNPDLYEIKFTEHLLDSLVENGRAIVIIPQSSMTGKTKEEKSIKENILKKHTLEGVITLNKDTFYSVGTMPCIAIFTTGNPHPKDKECKFIDFREDGFKVSPHIGLIETEQAKDKKQHLLDVWFNRIEATTKFCVNTTIEASDEWLHSFYYFNDEIPTDADFEKTVGDYLTFEFSMIMQNREYLFEDQGLEYQEIEQLDQKEWGEFFIGELFNIKIGKNVDGNKVNKLSGNIPYITRKEVNNGYDGFIDYDDNYLYIGNNSVITIGNETATPFVQTVSKFFTGTKVNIMKLKDNVATNVLFFITQSIKQQKSKYSYAITINSTRLKKQKILLPINKENQPDYAYMEQYIINLKHKKIKQYLQFKDKHNEK